MKIRERGTEPVKTEFGELPVGSVFRLCEDDYIYIKTNDGDANSVCLEDGDARFTAMQDACILLDAELIVSEVTE